MLNRPSRVRLAFTLLFVGSAVFLAGPHAARAPEPQVVVVTDEKPGAPARSVM